MQKTHLFCIVCALTLFAAPAAVANVASSGYVEERMQAAVHVVGDQTVEGTKTYTSSPVVPTPLLPEPETTEE